MTSRDKLSLCQSVSESVISGTKSGSDSQKLIAIGIETLMVLIDDQDPDVRMNADEALNRVIRVSKFILSPLCLDYNIFINTNFS